MLVMDTHSTMEEKSSPTPAQGHIRGKAEEEEEEAPSHWPPSYPRKESDSATQATLLSTDTPRKPVVAVAKEERRQPDDDLGRSEKGQA